MTALKLQQFGGMLPMWDERLLPEGQAEAAINSYVFSGALTPWRQPEFIRNLTNSAAASVFRIPNITFDANGVESFSNSITAPSTWLEFDDIDTTVVRSQVVSDQFQRFYFASPSTVPAYNTYNRILASQPSWQLGIPAPACAPLVGVSGGGNNLTQGATVGNGAQTTLLANTVYLLPIIPTGAVTVSDIQFMPGNTNATVNWNAVVYADVNEGGAVATEPGVLLGQGITLTGVLGGVLSSSAFQNPPALLANTPYWIGIMADAPIVVQTAAGSNSFQFTNTYSNGPPGVAPNGTKNLPNFQMYADLTTSAVFEARSYVYTYVSAYGEESPPSPYTIDNGWANGTWSVGLFNPPATEIGTTMNLAILRLYRTVTATGGTTAYFFVADISLGSTDPDAIAAVAADTGCLPPAASYTDVLPDSTVALNTQLPSVNYFPPPANLQGILALPNGMYVGFVNNQLYFSEPYSPHAWPPGNVYTTDFPIVGIGFTSGTVVACTESNPWCFSGTSPSQMSALKCSMAQPCTSRGSIVSLDSGVYYISPNGLIQVVSPGVVTNLTELWFKYEDWAQLVPQYSTRSIFLSSCYFSYGSVSGTDTTQAQRGFTIELDQDNTSFSIWPQPGGHRVGFGELTAPSGFNITNFQRDPWTSFGIVIQNGAVYYYNFQDAAPPLTVFDWTSKIYQQNTKMSFEAFKVWFNVPPGSPSPTNSLLNIAPANDPSWQTLGPNAWLYVLIYADVDDGDGDGSMQLVTAREIRRSGELKRILSDFKAEAWQIRLIGRVTVSNMQLASSAKELASI